MNNNRSKRRAVSPANIYAKGGASNVRGGIGGGGIGGSGMSSSSYQKEKKNTYSRFIDACKFGNVNIVRVLFNIVGVFLIFLKKIFSKKMKKKIMLDEISANMSVSEYAENASKSVAMHAAVEGPNCGAIVRYLLDHGFNPNVRGGIKENDQTPLITCI